MKPTDFSVHVTSFLTHYLAAQRNLSPNTIKAYRDVFTLLLRFCRDVQGIAPERLRLEQIDVSLVEAFLDYLERERKSSPQTRNHRLAALHAFFRYVQAEEPACMHQPKFDVICAHYILHFLSRRLSTARRICSCLLVSVISRPSLNPLFGSRRYTRYKPSSSWSAS